MTSQFSTNVVWYPHKILRESSCFVKLVFIKDQVLLFKLVFIDDQVFMLSKFLRGSSCYVRLVSIEDQVGLNYRIQGHFSSLY